MARYIIIHGSFSSNESNWFPWLANVLRGDGLEVNVPQMPVGEQNFESRSEELDKLNVSEKSAALIITLALTLTTIP